MKGVKTATKLLTAVILCFILYMLWQNTLETTDGVQDQTQTLQKQFVLKNTAKSVNNHSSLVSNSFWPSFTPKCAGYTIKEINPLFTTQEEQNISQCVRTFDSRSRQGYSQFWSKRNYDIRIKYHTYLNSNSIIIDIGGNVGEDAEMLIKHQPRAYFLFEPIHVLYKKLVNKFQNNSRVYIYNFGLSKKDQTFEVDFKGREGDATSMFESPKSKANIMSLKTINASTVFLKIGVPCIEPDLITINCEGCEFEVLENILHTEMSMHLKHIQFATHPKIASIPDVKNRYCKIQSLLRRTHFIGYQHFGCWETWIRKPS